MKKVLLYIPPLAHLLGFKKFMSDKSISLMTKTSIFAENMLLYTIVGALFYIGKIPFVEMFLIVMLIFLIVSPFEYELIKKLNKTKLNIITNWNTFKSFNHYFFNQYQVCGYIFIGYILAMILL